MIFIPNLYFESLPNFEISLIGGTWEQLNVFLLTAHPELYLLNLEQDVTMLIKLRCSLFSNKHGTTAWFACGHDKASPEPPSPVSSVPSPGHGLPWISRVWNFTLRACEWEPGRAATRPLGLPKTTKVSIRPTEGLVQLGPRLPSPPPAKAPLPLLFHFWSSLSLKLPQKGPTGNAGKSLTLGWHLKRESFWYIRETPPACVLSANTEAPRFIGYGEGAAVCPHARPARAHGQRRASAENNLRLRRANTEGHANITQHWTRRRHADTSEGSTVTAGWRGGGLRGSAPSVLPSSVSGARQPGGLWSRRVP